MNCFGLLLCLSTYLLVGTDAALDDEKIVGGEIAHPNNYKYQVYLESGVHFCGGAILSNWHILTAAHCVMDDSGQFTTVTKTVVAGAFDLKNRGPHAVTIDVEKMYVPKKYNGEPGSPGDIAVLKLSRPLCLCKNKNLSKVELPEEGKTYAGEKATVTGYGWSRMKVHTNCFTGKESEDGCFDTRKKKFAITDVLTNAECQREYLHFTIHSALICARVHQRSDKPEGVCTGDSGGPLVHNGNVIIGVLNNSPLGCDERRSAGVYARVSTYLTFIHNAMADHELNSMKVYEYSRAGPSSRPTGRSWCNCIHGEKK